MYQKEMQQHLSVRAHTHTFEHTDALNRWD